MLTQGKFPDNGTITLSHFGSIESADENLAVDLIEKMLRMNPTERPSAEQILSHAFFWDSKKILATFANIIKDSEGKTDADMIKISVIKNALNDNSALVIYGNWKTKVDNPFSDDLKVKRNLKLQGDCVFDLIRYIRNKYTHLKDQTLELQALLGENDDDFLKYWTTKFPKIIVHTYIQLLNIPI